MKKILKYMRGYEKECVLGPLFKLTEAVFELLVPLVVQHIIDYGIAEEDRSSIWGSVGVLVLFGVVGLACALAAQYFAAKAAVGFSTRLSCALFGKVQSLSFYELDNLGTSNIITRMTNDVNQVQTGINLTLRLLLRSPFVVFGAMIMAFFVDVKCALIFLATIPVLSVAVFGIMILTIPLYRRVQNRLDRVLKKVRENLGGVRVIRAFCMEDKEKADFREENDRLYSSQVSVGRISALMNPLTYVIVNVAIIILIQKGAVRVESGILTQGAVVALYNYMSQILVELVKFANLIINVTKAVASGNRIQTVFEQENTLEHGKYSEERLCEDEIRFENVYLKYRGAGDWSLKDISFSVGRGQTLGILGGTGSGKSSLISLIPHFYDADKGRVLVFGHDVKTLDTEHLREDVAVVMQTAVLFRGTLRDNMKWGNKDATDEEITEAIRLAQGADIVASKEKGLDEMISEGGKNLSGGQRQRLTIARALVRHPKILILDDSASALDMATDAKLREAVASLKDVTKVIVSQRASSVLAADKIIVLDDGEISACGTHEELMNSSEIYREIYHTQFPEGEE